eukprot:12922580-Prorocentrum_lima.AAC.1
MVNLEGTEWHGVTEKVNSGCYWSWFNSNVFQPLSFDGWQYLEMSPLLLWGLFFVPARTEFGEQMGGVGQFEPAS